MRRLLLPLAACALVGAAAPAAQATFPPEITGLWVAGSCSEPAELLFITRSAWARLEANGVQVLRHAERFDRAGTYALAVGDDPEATRLLFRREADGLLVRDPPAKLPDASLPGDGSDVAFRRCASIPVALAGLHGEGLSFLAALDGIGASCAGGDGAACINRIWAWADVSGDGGLSVAEIARLVRGMAYVGTLAAGSTGSELARAVGAAGVAAIAAAWALLASVDYDGSGTVSAEELARDRFPPPGLAGLPAEATDAGGGPAFAASAFAWGLGALGGLLKDVLPLFDRGRP